MSTAEHRSRRLLAVGAWVLLAAIAAGLLTSIPRVDAAIEQSSRTGWAKLITVIVLVTVGAAAIAAWVGALWHAAATHRSSAAGRWALIAVLIFGNFVASFFYYFGYVYWLRPAVGDSAA